MDRELNTTLMDPPAQASGEYAAATSLLEEAASASSDFHDAYMQATALSYLGRLALAWGEHEQAREPLDRALSLTRQVRPGAVILPLVARAQLARVEGERDLARRLLEEAVSLARDGGEGPARALLALGDLAADEAATCAARRLYEEALELARGDRSKGDAARALDGLARLARTEGAAQEATRLQSEALQLRHESTEARGIVESLEVTARLALTTDRGLDAARLFGASNALRAANGFGSSIREVSTQSSQVASLRESFSAEELEAAFSHGAALCVDQALAGACNGKARGECGMDRWASLTEREREVAALVAEGMSNKGIAERLVITPATVKNHMSHIFTKLNISRRSELAEEVWRRRRESMFDEPDAPGQRHDGV